MRIAAEERETSMKTCQNCIHKDVCRYSLTASDDCGFCEAEDEARRTLRLIYADIVQSANRCKAKSQEYLMEKKPENAFFLRREGEIRSSVASRVMHYCRKIGFDPSGKGE